MRLRAVMGRLRDEPANRATLLVSCINLVDALGTGLFVASATVLLVTVVRLSPTEIGLALSIAGVGGMLCAVPSGMLADRVGARPFLVLSALARAAAYVLYLFVTSFATLVPVAILVAVTTAGWSAVQQTLVAEVMGEERRTVTLSRIRSVRNAGYAAGGLLAVVTLAAGGRGAFAAVVLANAASYAVSAALYRAVPRAAGAGPHRRREGPVRRLAAIRDARYVGLIAVSTVYASSLVVLDVAVPLWVTVHSAAPRPIVGALLALNTALVVVLQVRVSRGAETSPGAVRLLYWSAGSFVVACLLYGAGGFTAPLAAVGILLAATVALTFGEMLESPAWWTLSMALAPRQRRSEYLATFSLNYELVSVAGPALMALLVGAGMLGWGALALAFVAAAAAAALLLRRTDAVASSPGVA